MVNSNLIKSKMIEKGFTQKKLAAKLGMSPQSLNYKINNKNEFKVSEIACICSILDISDKDSCFFLQ